jgi:hypothetical protein
MSDRNSLFVKSLALLVVLAIGVVIGLYLPSSASSAADEVVGNSTDAEDSRFQPRGGSLALDAGRRFIYLPLNNPAVVSASMAPFMEDDDIVAGVVVDGQARAYPQWVLVAYHVVNDTINETPIMLAHCEICSGTSAFDPVVDGLEGKSLSFQIHGIANGTFSVYDYQSHTVWSPFTGRSFTGEMHPSRMNRIPLIVEPWEKWLKRFPDTEVLVANRIFIDQREHGRGETNQIGHDYIPDGFQNVANMEDTRLPYNELVYGVANLAGTQSIAFPIALLGQQEEFLRYEFAGEFYLLKKVGDFGVVAYRLRAEQEAREFHQISESPFRIGDDQGGIWNEFGQAVNENGEDLLVTDGYFTEWYEWVSGWPESQIAD